jgi:hypothetical protein
MQCAHQDKSPPSHLADDSEKSHLQVDFDRRPKLEFHGSKITSDAGLLGYRELDEVPGLTDRGGAALSDLRRSKNTCHLDASLLPRLSEQRGSPPAAYARLQSRQLPADSGSAAGGRALIFDSIPGEADQDRRQGRAPWPLCHIPAGGGRIPKALLAEILQRISELRLASLPP